MNTEYTTDDGKITWRDSANTLSLRSLHKAYANGKEMARIDEDGVFHFTADPTEENVREFLRVLEQYCNVKVKEAQVTWKK